MEKAESKKQKVKKRKSYFFIITSMFLLSFPRKREFKLTPTPLFKTREGLLRDETNKAKGYLISNIFFIADDLPAVILKKYIPDATDLLLLSLPFQVTVCAPFSKCLSTNVVTL